MSVWLGVEIFSMLSFCKRVTYACTPRDMSEAARENLAGRRILDLLANGPVVDWPGPCTPLRG